MDSDQEETIEEQSSPPSPNMNGIAAIDPGNEQSAIVVWNGCKVLYHSIIDNRTMLDVMTMNTWPTNALAIEMIQHMGMPAGRELFDTCVWVGRFWQYWLSLSTVNECHLVYRNQVKQHHCGSSRATDANIRCSIIDQFGGKEAAIGRKATPGPLWGIKQHEWSALAIAMVLLRASDQKEVLAPA